MRLLATFPARTETCLGVAWIPFRGTDRMPICSFRTVCRLQVICMPSAHLYTSPFQPRGTASSSWGYLIAVWVGV